MTWHSEPRGSARRLRPSPAGSRVRSRPGGDRGGCGGLGSGLRAGTLAPLGLALMLSVSCASSGGSGSASSAATADACWPCEKFPKKPIEVEIDLTRQSLNNSALRDWLDRLDRLREDLGECWRVQR